MAERWGMTLVDGSVPLLTNARVEGQSNQSISWLVKEIRANEVLYIVSE